MDIKFIGLRDGPVLPSHLLEVIAAAARATGKVQLEPDDVQALLCDLYQQDMPADEAYRRYRLACIHHASMPSVNGFPPRRDDVRTHFASSLLDKGSWLLPVFFSFFFFRFLLLFLVFRLHRCLFCPPFCRSVSGIRIFIRFVMVCPPELLLRGWLHLWFESAGS
jgi:hypothetical protein